MNDVAYSLILSDIGKKDFISFHLDELGMRECSFFESVEAFWKFVDFLKKDGDLKILKNYVPFLSVPIGEASRLSPNLPDVTLINFEQKPLKERQTVELPSLGLKSNKLFYTAHRKSHLAIKYMIPVIGFFPEKLPFLEDEGFVLWYQFSKRISQNEQKYYRAFWLEYRYLTD